MESKHAGEVVVVGFLLLIFSITQSEAKTMEEDLTLTFDQKIQLDKFREIVSSRLPHDYMKKDIYLIRWLRAKWFDLKEAERMLMDNLKWREENRMDTIHEENWSDLIGDFPYFLDSKNKEGKPVLYVNLGSMDFRKVTVAGGRERFLRYLDKIMDETCIFVREMGEKYQNVSQSVFLWNMDGWNFIQHGCLPCITVTIRFVFSYDSHFTGCAEKIILPNSPAIAIAPIDLARNALNHDTRDAIVVYGTNKQELRKALAKDFDFDQLPPELGGTKIYQGTVDDDGFY